MTKGYLIAAASLGLFAAMPAQAQLLGGGGSGGGMLGGALGGQLGGTLHGPAGSLRDLPRETLRSTRGSAQGSAKGSGSTTGSQRVDRRQGTVAIDRSFEGSLDAAGSKLISTPAGSGSAEGSASGQAAGSGSANAQLIGTDAVRDVTGRAVGRTRDAVAATRERTSGLVGKARSLPGTIGASGSGSGSASGEGSGSFGNGLLAAAGSGAAAGEGAFAVAPGMPVLAPNGERFGKVRQVLTDSRGRVQSVLVRAKDRDVSLPAKSLTGSGSVLVMGEGSAAAESKKADPAAE